MDSKFYKGPIGKWKLLPAARMKANFLKEVVFEQAQKGKRNVHG